MSDLPRDDDTRPVNAPPPADQSGKQTVEKWAEAYFPAARSGAPNSNLWKHAAAAALHHWGQYAHDRSESMQLTKEQYEAAIKAAETVNASGSYEPHEQANYGGDK